MISLSALKVIPLGFEPKTHALEGRCSNPTELRNHFAGAKVSFLFDCSKWLALIRCDESEKIAIGLLLMLSDAVKQR